MTKWSGLFVAAIAALAIIGLVSQDADAIIGRPLTPFSYAGVARRTVRRSAYMGGAYMGGGYAAPAMMTLPPGCAAAGGIYNCGAARYRPYYDGPAVVYQPVY